MSQLLFTLKVTFAKYLGKYFRCIRKHRKKHEQNICECVHVIVCDRGGGRNGVNLILYDWHCRLSSSYHYNDNFLSLKFGVDRHDAPRERLCKADMSSFECRGLHFGQPVGLFRKAHSSINSKGNYRVCHGFRLTKRVNFDHF